ncbi:MAG: substrate-binding domain-containing protein, partial [Hyphomonadaceae bacterium]|nr:substrate-binding domain-containing protein [Hyphomonadaceae bacterium]
DTEIATNIWPELTTIKQPIAEMSSRAVDLLTAYVQDDAEAMSTFSELLQYELVIRESVSKPSK